MTPDEDVRASKIKFIKAIFKDMEVRTASAGDLLKNVDLTYKPTKRKEAGKKMTALKTFLPQLGMPEATQQYFALMTSLDGSSKHATIHSKLQFALRNGTYNSIVPVFQLALCLPLDNACCERGFSAMNDIKTAKRNKIDKPLFPLMLIAMYEKSFEFDHAKLGALIAAT